ncbi:MAG TPA: peptide chain release factor N(5)-glutamine methyltransferase [Ktedonobacteraceae bacterium]|nr:peptide chain release factor N(5)-glutamine methyltransferase [Ktedonobacteraceae bacterium]
MTTIREALEQGTAALTLAGQTPKPRLDAQVLLSHVLDVERATLYTYPERLLTAQQEQRFSQLIERRKLGEPIAYLTGHKEFFGLDFLVDRRVLIPRPETELLVEAALRIIRERLASARVPVVADIGTGSGIIPITLAVQEPRLPYLYASDISSDALAVARLNCQRHAVERRVRLLQGDLLAPLPEPIDLLTANLPYVGTDEMEVLTPEVHAYEPHLALFSGDQGLDAMRRFFTEARQPGKLKPDAILLLEIGYQQRELLSDLLSELWPRATIKFTKDYAGWDRLLQVSL